MTVKQECLAVVAVAVVVLFYVVVVNLVVSDSPEESFTGQVFL